jgi:hypothetical protein
VTETSKLGFPEAAKRLTGVQKTAKVSPEVFKHATRQKTPAFARYEGTSAWRKYRSRVREFYRAQAAAE